MKNNKIYFEVWNADTAKYEWRPFSADDIDELMELEVVDTDSIGWAMKDKDAFNKAMAMMDEYWKCGKPYGFSDIVKTYMSLTDSAIYIEAYDNARYVV